MASVDFSDQTMALGVDLAASENEYQEYSWPVRRADNLPPYRADVKKSGSLNFLDPSGPLMGELYLYLYYSGCH